MSSSRGTPGQRRGNFASRKARGEQGGAAAGATKEKSHGFDARQYHQNANTHGIQSLRTFDCPVCDSKNTIRVDLNPRLREGTVRCTYCMSLRPIPEDLPYPYATSFVPSLENKADVFFKFNEMYNALLRKQTEGEAGVELSTSGVMSSSTGEADGSRKRPREDGEGFTDDDADNRTHYSNTASGVSGGHQNNRASGEEDGLLGGLNFYPADPDAAHDDDSGAFMPDALVGGAMAGLDGADVDDHGVYDEEANEVPEAHDDAGVNGGDGVKAASSQVAVEGSAVEEGVDDVDIADFFADSD